MSPVWRPEINCGEAWRSFHPALYSCGVKTRENVGQGSIFLRDPAKLRARNGSGPAMLP